MEPETYGEEAKRQRLRQRWQANESELERVTDLPAGPLDPAATERVINEEQREIEHQVGRSLSDDPNSGVWALTPRGEQLAEEVRQMFCERVGRSIGFEELTDALGEMRRTLGQRDVGDEEALRFLVEFLTRASPPEES